MQKFLRGADVRALADQIGRQAYRQVQGELQVDELEFGELRRITGKSADKHRQLVPGLGQLLFQGGEGCQGLGQLRLLGEQVGTGGSPELELALHEQQLFLLGSDDFPGRPDPGAQGCLLNRHGHDVRGKGELGPFEKIALVVQLGLQRLKAAPRPAEQVEAVRDADRCVVEGEDSARGIRLAERGAGELLSVGGKIGVHAGKERPELGPPILLRLAKRRLRCRQRRAVVQRLADQPVERFGAKQGPPLVGDLLARDEALRRARHPRRGSRLCRKRLRRISLRAGRLGRPEIGADCAAGERRSECHRNADNRHSCRTFHVLTLPGSLLFGLLLPPHDCTMFAGFLINAQGKQGECHRSD